MHGPINEGQIRQLVLNALAVRKTACETPSRMELWQAEGCKLSEQVSVMILKYKQAHVTTPRVIIHDLGGQENLFSSFAPFVHMAPNFFYLMVYDVSIILEAEAQSSVRLNNEGDYQHLEVKRHHMKYKDWINNHLSAISVQCRLCVQTPSTSR